VRAIWSLIAIFFAVNVAMRGAKVLLALEAIRLGAGPMVIGLVAAIFALFPMLLSVQAGRIADRIGPRRPILFGAIVMALAIILPAVAPGIGVLILSPALMGLGHIFIHTSVQAGVGALSQPNQRGSNYGNLAMGISAAAFAGPVSAALTLDTFGAGAGFGLMAALCAVVAVAMVLLWAAFPPSLAGGLPETPPSTRLRTFDLLALPGLRHSVYLSAVALTGTELLTFFLPVYGSHIGLSASAIGALLGAYAAAAFVVRALIGPLLRRHDSRAVLVVAFATAGVFFALMPLTGDFLSLLFLCFGLGMSLGLSGPLTTLLAFDSSPPGRVGEALGVRITANKFMQLVIPVAFGGIGAVAGAGGVFWACAATLIAGGLVASRAARSGRKPPD
jgi:MFS family permease